MNWQCACLTPPSSPITQSSTPVGVRSHNHANKIWPNRYLYKYYTWTVHVTIHFLVRLYGSLYDGGLLCWYTWIVDCNTDGPLYDIPLYDRPIYDGPTLSTWWTTEILRWLTATTDGPLYDIPLYDRPIYDGPTLSTWWTTEILRWLRRTTL